MRLFLFRGKTVDGGEWVKGVPVTAENGKTYIVKSVQFPIFLHNGAVPICNTLAGEFYEVDSHTVGEFTGAFDSTKWDELTDQERTEWLESYKEEGWDELTDQERAERLERVKKEWHGRLIFEGDILDYNFHVTAKAVKRDRGVVEFGTSGFQLEDAKIVGNIFDNPEKKEEGFVW